MSRRKPVMALLVSLLMLLSALSSAQDDLQEQRILLTFIPNIQFSPLYVGIETGYFSDVGLQITLEYLQDPEVVDLIAAGQEQFGIVSGEQVILSRSQGRDVVYVYEWFQEYPVGIVTSAGNEINSMADLAEMKVGIPGRFGASYSALTTLLMASDMTESDIQVDEIGFNAPDVFCLGVIDASVVYINNEPLQIRNRTEQGECADVSDLTVIPVSSVVDLVSNGVITSAELLASDPDLVANVLTAFDQSVLDTIQNPARAYLHSLTYVENLPASDDFIAALESLEDMQDEFLATNPDRDAIIASRQAMYDTLSTEFGSETLLQFEILLATISLWDAERLGYSDLESWEAMQDTLLAMGFLEETIILEDAFTNDFVSAER